MMFSFFLAASLIIILPCGAAVLWTEADSKSADGGDRLVTLAYSEGSIASAVELLVKNTPSLIAGAAKKRAWSALATLHELSGQPEAAALAWSEAAFSEPGRRDDMALIESARCLTAVGETERALADVRTILLTGRDPLALGKARLWAGYISAFSGAPDATTLLATYAADPDYQSDRPSILFVRNRVLGTVDDASRLLAEYPSTPEARILAAASRKRVDLALTPQWLFADARPTAPSEAAGISMTPLPSDAHQAPVKPPAPVSTSAESAAKALQVGLFKSEQNAQSLVARLEAKKFASTVSKRKVGEASYWVVTVDPGGSVRDMTMKLKDAGFESFPLF
jgi:hypothetical protein